MVLALQRGPRQCGSHFADPADVGQCTEHRHIQEYRNFGYPIGASRRQIEPALPGNSSTPNRHPEPNAHIESGTVTILRVVPSAIAADTTTGQAWNRSARR